MTDIRKLAKKHDVRTTKTARDGKKVKKTDAELARDLRRKGV